MVPSDGVPFLIDDLQEEDERVGELRREPPRQVAHVLRAVLRRLGLHPTGANYKTLQATIARLGLDTRHFLGQGHLRGKSHGWARRLPLDVILVANSAYMSMWNLKRRLVSSGLLESKCSECGLTEWRGSRLVLVLDHFNGDPRDHRLGNLRLLCPNCNSQTPTFAGRNKRLRRLTASAAPPAQKTQIVIAGISQSQSSAARTSQASNAASNPA